MSMNGNVREQQQMRKEKFVLKCGCEMRDEKWASGSCSRLMYDSSKCFDLNIKARD